MSVIVVVVVAQQVLHGALQQAVLQVLLHGDLQTEGRSLKHTEKFFSLLFFWLPTEKLHVEAKERKATFLLRLPTSLKVSPAIQAEVASGPLN